ncbi:T9SS type A sorting domain-containing protein [Balneolales bacterium ANBcel1]|nr:T9SS type A sorting domain-containing protein [Balneolales bacterium ANBcel1]
MSKRMLPLLVALMCLVGLNSTVAQEWDDVIIETRGDTVVVLDAVVSGSFLDNTLADAIELDEDAPEGRVYELVPGGVYWFTRQMTTPERHIRVVGADNTRLVQSQSEQMPPNIHGSTVEGAATNGGFFMFREDLTLKNLISSASATDNSQGWALIEAQTAGKTLTFDNVLLEHNNWIFVQSNSVPNTSLHIRDSYFANMSGEACRRNGGVYDNTSHPTGELVVENSTHVMAQGMMYKFRGFYFERAFINHNTFVNAAGQLFTSFGYHTNLTVTNNLFVNSNVQGYFPGLDIEETDQDELPHGIINVNHLPEGDEAFEGYGDADRKILVFNNGVFWDERLDQIVQQLNENEAQDRSDWVTQMITMNSRTQEIFDDNDRYPLFNEGNWVMGGNPDFVNPENLMTEMVEELILFSVDTADDGPYVLPKWRIDPERQTERGGDDGMMPYPDWPIPVDLSYSNSAYLTAGLGGMPLGDLNWFADSKAQFEADKEALYAELESALNEGRDPQFGTVSVENPDRMPQSPTSFELAQNYPNPFNPATQIRFTLQNNADVKLEVFDVTGKLVTTLINDSMNAGSHTVTWNAETQSGMSVSSGVYVYRLTVGDQVQARTMTLIK